MADCSDLAGLQDSIGQIIEDGTDLNAFTHGAEEESVLLGGVDTPTIRGLVAEVRAKGDELISAIGAEADGILGQTTAQANLAISAADQSCECAAAAAESLDSLQAALEGIDGFESASYAFYGLRMEGATLVLDKGENGDRMNINKYLWCNVLPSSARIFIDGNDIVVEVPFSA